MIGDAHSDLAFVYGIARPFLNTRGARGSGAGGCDGTGAGGAGAASGINSNVPSADRLLYAKRRLGWVILKLWSASKICSASPLASLTSYRLARESPRK